MGGVGGGDGPAGVPGAADAGVALGGSFGGQGTIGGVPFGGEVVGPNFGDVPGALSDLGGLTFSSAVPAIAGAVAPTVAGIFGGPLVGLITGLAMSALQGDIGKGFGNVPGQLASMGFNAASKGVGYGLPGMVIGELVSGLVGNRGGGESQPGGNIGMMGLAPGGEGGFTQAAQVPAILPQVTPPVASPVAQAVAPPPMLSAQPFGWYSQGMKRVNMPWVSQPGSQQLRGNPSGNYGGMKRVG